MEVTRIIYPLNGLKIRMPDHNFRPLSDEGARVQWPGPAGHWARAEARKEIRSEPDPLMSPSTEAPPAEAPPAKAKEAVKAPVAEAAQPSRR